MDLFVSYGYRVWILPQVRDIEALSSAVDIMVASPSVHFQTIR
jgi:hypothetical protein